MPELGWVALGGNEIVNNARVAAYAHGLGVRCGCPNLAEALGDGRYRSPQQDRAPWYEKHYPESADFWGVLGLEIHGASQSTMSSVWTDLIGDGAVRGASRRGARQLEFKVLLIARTEAGLSYGISWLASALRGSGCHTGCGGDELCLLAGCPQPPVFAHGQDPCLEVSAPHVAAPIPHEDGRHPQQGSRDYDQAVNQPAPAWDGYAAADELMRSAYDVALLEFANDEKRQRLSGAWTCELTFTLKAGNPGWYSHPVTLVDSRRPDQYPPPSVADVMPAYRIDQAAPCPQPVDCLAASPYLNNRGPWGDEPFPGSDPLDPNWRDPGYPTHPFDAQRVVYASPAQITPGWLEKVPVIEVYSGCQDVHRMTVRFYANPRNKPVGPALNPCDACNEITLPWIPARTKVVLDGRRQAVEVTCPDRNVLTSDVVLYGALGKILEWPVFDCGMPMIVEMFAQVGTAPDSWYRVRWSAKADAI